MANQTSAVQLLRSKSNSLRFWIAVVVAMLGSYLASNYVELWIGTEVVVPARAPLHRYLLKLMPANAALAFVYLYLHVPAVLIGAIIGVLIGKCWPQWWLALAAAACVGHDFIPIVLEMGNAIWEGRSPAWSSGSMEFRVYAISLLAFATPVFTLAMAASRLYRQRTYRLKIGNCANCGYALRGSPNARCPECGLALAQTPSAATGEASEGVSPENSIHGGN